MKRTAARMGLDLAKVKSPRDLARALELHRAGRLLEAGDLYAELVRRHGDHPEAKYGAALLAHAINENTRAVALFDEVIAKRPKFTAAIYNRGVAHQALGNVAEAERDYRRALQIEPQFVSALSNLGNALLAQGRVDEAMQEYERAISASPHDAEPRFNRAHALLLTGRWEEGWKEYEQRWNMPGFTAHNWRPPGMRKWEGESLDGKTLVVIAEQGLGDTIMALRYHYVLTSYPGSVIRWHIQKPLVRLWGDEIRAEFVTPEGSPLPTANYWITTMSLPHYCETEPDTVPYSDVYMRFNYRRCDTTRRIGLCWAGSPGHLNDANRSIPWPVMRGMLDTPGVEWVSLQVGPRAEDALGDGLLPPYVQDFADTADLLATLDLVISVDTSVVHLAGAMGVPCWCLLAAVPDNRWMLGRSDTPWYDSVRLWRQPIAGDWGSVMANVTQALTEQLRRAA